MSIRRYRAIQVRPIRALSRRFWRDERGQGILFAAASLVMLVGFVALVYNVGRLTERRTKVQLAADACAYSGATVAANSLSLIGWSNSAMAQVYYNAMKYAVDVNAAGVAAAAERMQGIQDGSANQVYNQVLQRAMSNLPEAKRCMVALSQVQNSSAILTPRLAEEEMFAVGARAGTVGEERGAERLSLFPSLRLFPRDGGEISYRIEQFDNGWRITNLSGGNSEMVEVRLINGEWHIEYSTDGMVHHAVVIREEDPQGGDELQRWSVQYFQPPGNLVQEIILVQTTNLGWVVWGSQADGGDIPAISFEPVDMDGDGINEGTQVTYEGISQVFMRGPTGALYVWDSDQGEYVDLTSEETTIAGVTVRINVTNVINFPQGSATIGDPTEVHIGGTHLTLVDPPIIRTGLGPISISIRGFDEDSFTLSAGGFSLTHGDADGIWRKHYNRHEEYWWQHRLTEQDPIDPEAIAQWQYDRMALGAHMRYETNHYRFKIQHAIEDRWGEGSGPTWMYRPEFATGWFDPISGAPVNTACPYGANDFSQVFRPDGSYYYALAQSVVEDLAVREDILYVTLDCQPCGGLGGHWEGEGEEAHWVVCSYCGGRDHDRDGVTETRAFVADLIASQDLNVGDYYRAAMYDNAYGIAAARMPLVLAPEFFQFGLNVGAWRGSSKPMLFPESREPDWGMAAIASARIGIPDPDADGGYREQFDDPDDRESWCDNSIHNLYAARIRPRLVACRGQIMDSDLEHDTLIGGALQPIEETGLSYLWDAILGAGHVYGHNNWLDEYDGRADASVGASLRNMRNRSDHPDYGSRRFDFRDDALDQVIEH